MDTGNIAPGQTPTPGLGSSSQSTTSSSLGGSDSYPEHAAQWGQDWNTGGADTSENSDDELYALQKGKGKGKSESFNGICYNCGKSGIMQKVEKQKERERRETAKVGMTVKVGQSESDGQKVKVGTRQVKVGSNKGQEKTVRDGDWCAPVKHIAKLSHLRGSTSTKTNIKFFVDPEEEDRDNDTTSDCLGSKQFALEDDVSYKCSCCEADGMQWKRTRNLTIMKPSARFPA